MQGQVSLSLSADTQVLSEIAATVSVVLVKLEFCVSLLRFSLLCT
jgi:hypothetical protein